MDRLSITAKMAVGDTMGHDGMDVDPIVLPF